MRCFLRFPALPPVGRKPVNPVYFVQSLTDGAFDGFMHSVRVYKANFVFGRMHVNIHLIKRNFDKNNSDGKLPLHQALRKSLKDTVLDRPVAHKPAVDKDIDSFRGAAGDSGGSIPAADRNDIFTIFEGVEIRFNAASEHICNPGQMIRTGGPAFNAFFIVKQAEMHIGPTQRDSRNRIRNMSHFRHGGL